MRYKADPAVESYLMEEMKKQKQKPEEHLAKVAAELKSHAVQITSRNSKQKLSTKNLKLRTKCHRNKILLQIFKYVSLITGLVKSSL